MRMWFPGQGPGTASDLLQGKPERIILVSGECIMATKRIQTMTADDEQMTSNGAQMVSREQLIERLNEDLAREYQAIIGYVVYSQVIKGAQYMNIAGELEKHAGEELAHAIAISKQVDYLGGMPVVVPKTVKTSEKAEDMLRFD